MNIFGTKINREEDVDLAIALFNTLQLSTQEFPKDISRKVNKLVKSLPDRQDLLNKVIELAGSPETPKKRWILAKAYSWSRVEKRKEAINFINLYLENDLYLDAYQHLIHSVYAPKENNSMELERKIHASQFYKALGDMYSGEKMFADALASYQSGYKLTPFFASSVYDIADVYIKLNRLDLAKSMLEVVMNSEYYKTNVSHLSQIDRLHVESYRKVILGILDEVDDKIAKNYVYRPRITKK